MRRASKTEGGRARLLIAGPLSVTGRYAVQGRLAAVGFERAVNDIRRSGGVGVGRRRLTPEALIVDDGSTERGLRRALEEMGGADLLIGPYASDLVAKAATWAAEQGKVLWNHGASADEVQRLPGAVSVSSPASRYAVSLLEALADRLPGGRVFLAVGRGAFGRAIQEGAVSAAERLGMRIVGALPHREVPDAPATDLLFAAGSCRDDVELVRRLRRPSVLATVAGGLADFGAELGPLAEGVLAPSQWEEGAAFHPDVGPSAQDVVRSLRAGLDSVRPKLPNRSVDYPSAQAYAAVLLATRCIEQAETTEDEAVYEVARGLHCTTFFGKYGLGGDGLQADHELLVVQWQKGAKQVVWPSRLAEAPLSV